MAKPIKLEGATVLEISAIEHNLPYKPDTAKGKAGKTYSRFRYDGILFTVDSDNPFVNDFVKGQVKSAKVMDTMRDVDKTDADGVVTTSEVRSIEFDSYISRAQWNALRQDDVDDAKIDFQINRFKKLETAPITDDMLSELATA
jgi:hypothetical protein